MVRTNHPELACAIDRSLDSLAQVDRSAEEHYFKNTVPPEYLGELEKDIEGFLSIQRQGDRKIAVVTSGGTTVPLENNTVRFIDNFSAGTRGSISAEYFLNRGYAVIFLHREFSLRPFSQHYANVSIMDLLELQPEQDSIRLKPEYYTRMKHDLESYAEVKSKNLLLEVPFTTVNQYLHTLRLIGRLVQPLGDRVMFYLAAAVSDFFLPMSKISEHKIQSKGMAKLVVDLDPVPKLLATLANKWTPGAFIVSFKLETDQTILLSKCRDALEKYGHQLVVGNLLQTRKDEVYLVSPTFERKVVRDSSDEIIEDKFLPIVLKLHEDYIQKYS